MKKLRPEDRRERILRAISVGQSTRIPELARELDVSAETIRRDLDFLHEKGIVRRHFGGAIINPVGIEPSWSERLDSIDATKQPIARAASKLIEDGEVLFLGAGSTAFVLAKYLASENRQNVIITNNIAAANAFPSNSRGRIIVAPGELDKGEGCTLGPDTLCFLERYWADTTILSVSGLAEHGGSEITIGLASILRAMISRSSRLILILDHTKFGIRCLESVFSLEEIDILVTDKTPPSTLLDCFKNTKTQIIISDVS